MMKIAQRAQRIEPFYVMEVAKAAAERAALVAHTDAPMIFLNIGEPDFTAPPLVQEAAARAVHDGVTQYTPALGISELRERISAWYSTRFGVNVPARRIVITAGASAALQLACLALIEAGDEVLMPDPSYPCNRHFVSAAEGRAVLIPTTAAERFQLSAEQVRANWTAHTRGVLWAVSVAAEIVWFFTQSRWLPKFSLSMWMFICAAAMVLRMMLTTWAAEWLWALLFAQVLHALTFATQHTACIALLSHHFPGRLRGRGQALYASIGYGVPGVLGALGGGALSDALGLSSVYAVSIATAALACVCAWQCMRQHAKH